MWLGRVSDWEGSRRPPVYCRRAPKASRGMPSVAGGQVLIRVSRPRSYGCSLQVDRLRRHITAVSTCCATTKAPAAGARSIGSMSTSSTSSRLRQRLARVIKPTGALWLTSATAIPDTSPWAGRSRTCCLAPEAHPVEAESSTAGSVRNRSLGEPNQCRQACGTDSTLPGSRSTSWSVRRTNTSNSTPSENRTEALAVGTRTLGPASTNNDDGTGPVRWPVANDGLIRARAEGRAGHRNGKKSRRRLTYATAGFRGAHFATFPQGC